MTGAALWTADEVEAATGGHGTRPFEAAGVSIDSRTLKPSDLFVALKGPRFDGHDFVADALERGAAAAVVNRVPEPLAKEAPLVIVDETLAALNGLARAARNRAPARVIGVTGTVGKTGVKEALKLVLRRQAETAANLGNLNNHWGVPLSLARMPRNAVYGVFELGMNHPGELGPLARLLCPDVVIITSITPVHTEFFSSILDIAEAKAEVFESLAGGTAVLNRDNPYFPMLAVSAWASGAARVTGFGAHPEAAARLIDCALDATSSSVTAVINGLEVNYRLGVPGRHWVMNSLAVLAAVGAVGGDVGAAAAALADFEAPSGRGRRHRVPHAGGSFTLIDESYNASPASMRAAVEILAATEPGTDGRRIAVLGDMLELGSRAPGLHADLAEPLTTAGIDLVFTAGPHMANLAEALPVPMRAAHEATAGDLAPLVMDAVRPGDVVTVKGSLASNMARIVETLLHGESAPRRAVNEG